MDFKPSFASFIRSVLYSLSPAITAAIMMYFLADSARFIVKILSGLMFLFSLYLLIQDFFVHLQRLYLDETRIRSKSLLTSITINWPDVVHAELRERENAISGTDHLLIIKSGYHQLVFNTSTLSKEHEKKVIEIVKQKCSLVIINDKPAI